MHGREECLGQAYLHILAKSVLGALHKVSEGVIHGAELQWLGDKNAYI